MQIYFPKTTEKKKSKFFVFPELIPHNINTAFTPRNCGRRNLKWRVIDAGEMQKEEGKKKKKFREKLFFVIVRLDDIFSQKH